MAKPYAPLLQQLLLEFKSQRLGSAEQIAKAIIKRNPKDLVALQILGLSLAMQGRVTDAVEPLIRAAKEDPKNPELLSNLAKALHTVDRHLEAILIYQQLIELIGPKPELLTDLGTSFAKIKDYQNASRIFNQAIDSAPNYFLVWCNHGNLLAEQKQTKEAIISYEKSIQLNLNYPESWTNLGNALFDLSHYEKSIECHERALALNPNYAEALLNKGNAYLELKNIAGAYNSYLAAFNKKIDIPYLFGQLYSAKMSLIEWNDLDSFEGNFRQSVLAQNRASLPFNVLSFPDLQLQLNAAQVIVKDRYPTRKQNLIKQIAGLNPTKIRIAYFSSDFHDHPVGILMERILQLHDRSKFEILGVYLKPLFNSPLSERLHKLFDEVLFLDTLSDDLAEELLLSKNIDVAIDLNGHTSGNRMIIFANRIAPIQVNYLGYAGTSGADYFDYIICDSITIPQSDATFFTEKLALLPNSFFPADSLIREFGPIPSRVTHGLPPNAFIFSCFNNAYKLNPTILDVWMRLLLKIPHSVLWLSSLNGLAKDNLLKEVKDRGVDINRIIFANKVPDRADHLSRLRCADLFLDTPNYNAHATSADSLWAGVPVLTVYGVTFAGRVTASHLNSLGMNELVVENLEQYEQLAEDLATNPSRIRELREKLSKARLTKSLFDSKVYVGHLEELFCKMFSRAEQQLSPDHIQIN
jgi:protein O-GlcNAc transferase